MSQSGLRQSIRRQNKGPFVRGKYRAAYTDKNKECLVVWNYWTKHFIWQFIGKDHPLNGQNTIN